MSYLQWLGIFFGIPMLVFLLIAPEIFSNHRKIFFKILFAVLLIGLPTDFIAVNIGLWQFPKGLSGLNLLTIPIEEYLWAGLYSSIVVFLTLYFLKKQNL
jgi:lycopene cyclase domain-containing protein